MSPRGFFVAVLTVLLASSYSWAILPATDSQGQALPTLAPLLERVNPAVVNISTSTTRTLQQNPLFQDPHFRRFFNVPPNQQAPRQQRSVSAGSGVIIDARAGTVVTNYHVIDNADDIQVALENGRTYKATLIGSDPAVDIAVLQLEDPESLVEVPLADSDGLKQGDFVIAIGNPFGLGHTVTHGMISALGRSGLGIEGYENFIQTDASINPGNSGGALVNLRGELVGINTAILAPTGGNVGIGFAIPTNMLSASVEQILEHGEVKRGQLGVLIQNLTPDLADAFGIDTHQRGAIIAGVQPHSAADKAGLEAEDVVIRVDDNPVETAAQLRNEVGIRRIGETLTLTILREGKEQVITATIGEADSGTVASASSPQTPSDTALLPGAILNSTPKTITVAAVDPGSPAASGGLMPGDRIVSVNRQPVTTIKSLKKGLKRDAEKAVFRISRQTAAGPMALFVVVKRA